MKKKICFILPTLGGGGAEKVALNLLNSINLEKYELYLILTWKKGNYYKELRSEVQSSELGIKRARNSVKSLKIEIEKIKPDIVLTFSIHLNTMIGLFIAPFLKNKISFISREINVLSKVKLGFLRKFLLKLAYKNSSKIISQSDDMTIDLKQYLNINSDKIYQISNPVDCHKIKEKLNEKNPFENSKLKNILCVGRLESQKGFDILIKSFAKIKNENFVLNILGEGSQREYLEKICLENNISHKVKFLGFQKNPYIYMKYSDLFILSSRFEGFPNALLEATYCGLYSIANDCKGGIKEIILDEINGKIINIENYIELEKALSSFETKKVDRKEISKITENKYSTKIIVQRYEKLFEEILKK